MDGQIWRLRDDVAAALPALMAGLHWGADPILDGPLGMDEDVSALLESLAADEPCFGRADLAGSAASR